MKIEIYEPVTGYLQQQYNVWPIWVRLSNGVGWKQADKELDARGFAMKVMGVPGPKMMNDEHETQDFLLTNSPGPVGKNAEEFMQFAHANSRGTIPTILLALSKPRSILPAIIDTKAVDSMLTTQYWSGGPYHLGAHQTVKTTVKSCEQHENNPDKKDPDFLRTDLETMIQSELCFTFYVQFQVDPQKTPIEDAAKVWETSISPEIPVADIHLRAQDFSTAERDVFCDKLSFNPWHGISAHQPMGHINRARRAVYDASRNHRGGSLEPQQKTNPVPQEKISTEPELSADELQQPEEKER